jgi:hypothetical protein
MAIATHHESLVQTLSLISAFIKEITTQLQRTGFCIPCRGSFGHNLITKRVWKWQLDSLTNVIDAKTHQLMQLRMVVFDGNKSRLQAKKELEDVGEALHSLLFASMCSLLIEHVRLAHCSENCQKFITNL